MKKILIIVSLTFLVLNITAQQKNSSLITPVEYSGKIKPVNINDSTRIKLVFGKSIFPRTIKKSTEYIERDHEEFEEILPDSILFKIKKLQAKKYLIEKKKLFVNGNLELPGTGNEVTSKFVINERNGGCPPDNTVAISQSGFIVAADNAQIGFYKEDGTNFGLFSYPDFLNPVRPGLGDETSDPKVIYDYEADRFVFFVQIYSNDVEKSECVLAFSKTENPADGWNVYVFHQFRDKNPHRFDYPGLAYNKDEVFLTGILKSTGGNVIFQMDKDDGYNARDIDCLMWLDIRQPGNNQMAFGIFPMQTIPNLFYDKDMLFASISAGGGSSCYYYRINNRINGNPQLRKYEIDIEDYLPATLVSQNGTDVKLDGGKVKIRGGFFVDNRIYFVFVKPDKNGFNGIAFVRINIENFHVKTKFFHDNQHSEYGQPNIVHSGNSEKSHQILLTYQRSGINNWPEIRMRKIGVSMSAEGNSITLQTSENFRKYCGSLAGSRWGDYIGIQRRGSSNTFWVAGHTANSNKKWRSHLIKIQL